MCLQKKGDANDTDMKCVKEQRHKRLRTPASGPEGEKPEENRSGRAFDPCLRVSCIRNPIKLPVQPFDIHHPPDKQADQANTDRQPQSGSGQKVIHLIHLLIIIRNHIDSVLYSILLNMSVSFHPFRSKSARKEEVQPEQRPLTGI